MVPHGLTSLMLVLTVMMKDTHFSSPTTQRERTQVHIHTPMRTRPHTHMYAHAHTHTHLYILIHTRAFPSVVDTHDMHHGWYIHTRQRAAGGVEGDSPECPVSFLLFFTSTPRCMYSSKGNKRVVPSVNSLMSGHKGYQISTECTEALQFCILASHRSVFKYHHFHKCSKLFKSLPLVVQQKSYPAWS